MREPQTQGGSDPSTVLALRLGPDDDVAVLTANATSGAHVRVDRDVIRAIQDVARGHKIALRPIAAGDPVRKYGQIIGFATATVTTGEHVHSHNLEFRTFSRVHVPGAGTTTTGLVAESDRLSFDGIVRADGRVATRNYLGILTSVNCSATVAKLIARHFSRPGVLDEFPGVDGIVALTHTGGCGMDGHGEGLEVLRRTLTGFAASPQLCRRAPCRPWMRGQSGRRPHRSVVTAYEHADSRYDDPGRGRNDGHGGQRRRLPARDAS